MNLIVGKQPLEAGRSEMIDIISTKTGLKSKDVILIVDAFSLIIRKMVIEQGAVAVSGIGKFFVKPLNYTLYDRKYHTVEFKAFDDLRERVKGTRKDLIVHCFPFVERLKVISKMFGLKLIDVKYLFRLYLTSIAIILKKYKEYRIPRIGTIRLKPLNCKSGITKKWNYNKPVYSIIFKMSDPFFRELNKQINQYNTYERLRQMLYLVGESRDIIRKGYTK